MTHLLQCSILWWFINSLSSNTFPHLMERITSHRSYLVPYILKLVSQPIPCLVYNPPSRWEAVKTTKREQIVSKCFQMCDSNHSPENCATYRYRWCVECEGVDVMGEEHSQKVFVRWDTGQENLEKLDIGSVSVLPPLPFLAARS